MEYYYGELPEKEKDEIVIHLENCQTCATELKAITAVLEKVSRIKRPVLAGSLYPSIKEKLEQKRTGSGKFWNLPFAAGVGLLILLSVFSNSQNISSMKKADLNDPSIVSNVIDMEDKDLDSLGSLDVEILADELFMEENLMNFES